MAVGYEVCDFPVRIAGDVMQIVACVFGRSSNRCIGMMGEEVGLAAYVSGRLWNSEKLQKYLSANSLSSDISSSGICFCVCANKVDFTCDAQYMLSMSARVRKSTMPWLNRSSDSSLICWASCQSSRRGTRVQVVPNLIHVLYQLVSFRRRPEILVHTGKEAVSVLA